jgi:hypothetical protein
MALTERLALIITGDASGAIKEIDKLGKTADKSLGTTEDRFKNTGLKMQQLGAAAVGVGGLFVAGLTKAAQKAGELEQAVGGTEAVFGEASDSIDEFAKGAAKSMGLSERAFREATTSIGGTLKRLGYETDEAADKSVELTKVAADLAATYGGTTAEAVTALGAAFRGEADPAERFNLGLKASVVNAKAVALGLAETESSVSESAKAQATYALIMEQSADAQGQFARETDTLIGKQQIAAAETENATAALGQGFAPIMAKATSLVGKGAEAFIDLDKATGGAASQVAAIGSVVTVAGGALSILVGHAIKLHDQLVRVGDDGSRSLTKLGKVATGIGLAATFAAIGAGIAEVIKKSDDAKISMEQWGKATDQELVAAFQKLIDLDAGRAMIEFKALAEGNVGTADRLVKSLDDLGVNSDRYREIVDKEILSQRQLNLDQEAGATVIEQKLNPATKELTESTEDAEKAVQSLLDAVLASFDSQLAYENKTRDMAEALDEMGSAALTAFTTVDDKGTIIDEATVAQTEYQQALNDAAGAALNQAAAATKAAEDQAKANGTTLSAADATKIQRDELDKVAQTLAPGSDLRRRLEGYIAELDGIPANKTTTIEANVNIRENFYRGLVDATKKRAGGGPVMAGESYVVGENQAELFTPQRSGYIHPSVGGGSGATVNIYMPPGADGDDVVRAIKDWERRNGPLGSN